MATTYTSLVADVPVWLYAQNRDIVAKMPKLISDAEDQIYLRFDHDLFKAALPSIVVSAGTTDIDLSGLDILEVRSIQLRWRDNDNQWTPVLRRDLEAMSMLYSTNRPDRPVYYSEYGSQTDIRLFPTPRHDLLIKVMANVAPPKLGPAQDTNIITERYPRVIERAVMRQGAIFMKNQQDAATYEKEMNDALSEANAQIRRHRRDEATDGKNSGGMA